MATRMQPITPYNRSQGPSNEPKEKEPSVAITSRMSKVRRSGEPDPLKQSLIAPPRRLPEAARENEPFGFKRSGRYAPDLHWSPMQSTGQGQGVYSYGGNRKSAKPSNAVGNPPNRIGGNALGAAFRPRGGGGGRGA